MAVMNDLPNKILIKIFSYLEIIERQHFVKVCKRWNSLIESMWLSNDKVILQNCSSGVFSWTGDGPIIFCGDFTIMAKVLEKFNSNLKKIIIDLHCSKIRWFNWKGVRGFCDEFQTHKQLNTFKMNIRPSNADELAAEMMILKSIPTEGLQELEIGLGQFDINGQLINTIETLLEKTTLGYLHLNVYTSSMVEIINKMDTLETLVLGKCREDSPPNSVLLNITKLPNLKELSIHDPRVINDEFLKELGYNCKSLLVLHLYCGTGENITQSGLDAIGNLMNLKSLKFRSKHLLNIKMLCNLSNLEEFDLIYKRDNGDHELRLQQEYADHNLPNLKRSVVAVTSPWKPRQRGNSI